MIAYRGRDICGVNQKVRAASSTLGGARVPSDTIDTKQYIYEGSTKRLELLRRRRMALECRLILNSTKTYKAQDVVSCYRFHRGVALESN